MFPKLIGVIRDNFTVSFAMEFIGDWLTFKTITLNDLLYDPSLNRGVSRNHWLMVIKDIGEGLRALHSQGYIHADLHRNNVLIHYAPNSDRPKPKIIDLGYSTRRDRPSGIGYLNEQQKAEAYIRCPQLAPELIEGNSCYNVQTDIYAYGRIIKDIAVALSDDKLSSLADECTCNNAIFRCNIQHVLQVITKLI